MYFFRPLEASEAQAKDKFPSTRQDMTKCDFELNAESYAFLTNPYTFVIVFIRIIYHSGVCIFYNVLLRVSALLITEEEEDSLCVNINRKKELKLLMKRASTGFVNCVGIDSEVIIRRRNGRHGKGYVNAFT